MAERFLPARSGGGGEYGYQWWLETDPVTVWTAMGFAGQVISVVPEQRTVVVTHCRWRDLGRPSAEQVGEVHGFIRERLAPFLLPELADSAAGR